MLRVRGLAACAALLLACAARAQSGAADAAIDAARRALVQGDVVEASAHAQAALGFDEGSLAAYEVLLRASAEDLDARTLWSHEFAAAVADAKGKFSASRELGALLAPKDSAVASLAVSRATAVEELLELAERWRKDADKDPERGLWSEWAAATAREAAYGSAALRGMARERAPLGVPVSAAARKTALDALAKRLSAAEAAGDLATTIEVALVLRGLGAQARFDDLHGPPPPRVAAAVDAEEALARARAKLSKSAEPLTIEQLAELDADEREAFTRAHSSFASPGAALTPGARYRVETDCGHATLLGVAEVAELHHARLVGWYGADPFLQRQGLIRVTAESSSLESEGSPFWWAGGFQGGDVTTLRFACSTIPALGRGLTHELTHRFDGELFPDMPSWLAEGRAVWTAAAYADEHDERFVDEHALFGTIDDARFRGYGGRAELEKLIRGTIDDYRDNYVAGYALFVFLKSWGDSAERPKYARALDAFMRTRRSDKREALAAFSAHFCDGAEGRPKDFDGFVAEFREWISGFYWRDRKPFTERYVESPGPSRAGELVMDEPTWVWSRERAEPWFGQDQARVAGDLLARLGDERGAIAAYTWSLAVDEPSSRVELALAELHERCGGRDTAWILRRASQLREHRVEDSAGVCPLWTKAPKARLWLEALASAARGYANSGLSLSAAALSAQHDRIAARAGVELLPAAAPADPNALHPLDAPARNPMRDGWIEDGLTGFERHRVAGLWFVDERESLHVGRNQPRTASGTADREARLHHVFVRAPTPLEAGRYSIRARITPTTSFVSGALVFGYTRRDRNVRLSFSGGDYDYAIGDKEEPAELDSLGWSLGAGFEREPHLGGARCGGAFGFGRTVSSFVLEVLVDGGAVQALIEGEPIGVYQAPHGLHVAGAFGFAVSMGDFKVSELSVRRLDRSARLASGAEALRPWDLREPRSAPFDALLQRVVLSVPRDPRGVLLLCVPDPAPDEKGFVDVAAEVEAIVERARAFERFRERYGLATRSFVAVPGALGEDVLGRLRDAIGSIEAAPPARCELVTRAPMTTTSSAPDAGGATPHDGGQTWLLFIDSAGVLRVAEPFHSAKRLDGALERWVDVFRNR